MTITLDLPRELESELSAEAGLFKMCACEGEHSVGEFCGQTSPQDRRILRSEVWRGGQRDATYPVGR